MTRQLYFYFILWISIVCGIVSSSAQSIEDSTYIYILKEVGKTSYTDLEKAFQQLDSLLPVLEKRAVPVELSLAYRQYATILDEKNKPELSEKYFQASLNISKENNLDREWARSTLNYCSYLSKHKDPRTDSMYHLLEKSKYYQINPKEKAAFYINYSSFYAENSQIDKAIELLQQAIKIAEDHNFHKYDLFIHHKMGHYLTKMNLIEKALEHNRISVTLLDPKDQRLYSVYNNMASAFMDLNQLDSAKLYLNKVLEGSPKETSYIYTYQTLSNIATKEDEIPKSINYSKKCIQIAKKYADKKSECICRNLLALAYNKTQEYQKSENILKSCVECFGDEMDIHKTQHEILRLGNNLSLMGREDLAQKLQGIIDGKDSISTNTAKAKLQELETKYQTKEKEAQNKLLQAEKEVQEATIKKQQVWMSGLGVGLAGLLFGLFMFGKRSRERKKHIDVLASKNEKINALNRETIHRTKNYLHLATALLNKNKVNTDDPQIAEVLAENEKRLQVLSKINTKLSAADGKTHLSAKEYLSELIDDLSFSFQQTRHRGASIQAHVADVLLDSDKCLYLGLIINELIVNSFKHARPEGALQIEVDVVQTSDDKIQLTYHDNGEAFDQEHKKSSQGKGLIKDLFQQLKGDYTFGFKDGFSFDGSIPNA